MALSIAQAKKDDRKRWKAVALESRMVARAESRSLAEAMVEFDFGGTGSRGRSSRRLTGT